MSKKKYYINYSDEIFKRKQKFALIMAKIRGGFHKTIGYNRDDIDKDFYEINRNILDQKKGGGYWLWKPYFIYKTLNILDEGDYLFYSDSGAFFLKSVDKLITELDKYNQDIMGFELPLIESQWTKRELFTNMNCDIDSFRMSNQILASFILIKKTEVSMRFCKEYLNYASNALNVTDQYNSNVKQFNDFIDHRHDQSIFSLLYKKYSLKTFKDPTQYGEYPRGYAGCIEFDAEEGKLSVLDNNRKFRYFNYSEKYKLILFHNRNRNPVVSFIKFKIKIILSRLHLYNGQLT